MKLRVFLTPAQISHRSWLNLKYQKKKFLKDIRHRKTEVIIQGQNPNYPF